DAVVFMEFDQRVDAEAVLRNVQARAGASLKVRLAKTDEINADENVKAFIQEAVKGRWLALRAADANDEMPADSSITITVGAGTPSAEGPRVTSAAQAFSFRTYGALRVTGHECGDMKDCTPFDQWSITFSNPLDREAFDESQLKIEPTVENANVSVYGNAIYINGTKRGRTVYKATLDRSLSDQFCQPLQRP